MANHFRQHPISISPEPASNYPAPRDDPFLYPGRRPRFSFVLQSNTVFPLLFDVPGRALSGRVVLNDAQESQPLAEFLELHKATPLEHRFAVLGYGSNIVPGQLVDKFEEDSVIPVVSATVKNSDVVYNLISNIGYAFAELILDCPGVRGHFGVTFLDELQLGEMNRTEQNYRLAHTPRDVILASGETIPGGSNSAVYMYAGFRKVWVPKALGCPVLIAELPSDGRSWPGLTQVETLDLAIREFSLKDMGIHTARELTERVRSEANWEERPPKLKYLLQQQIEESELSMRPLAEQVVLVGNDGVPTRTYGDLV